MKMTVIPIVVGALGTIPYNLEKRLSLSLSPSLSLSLSIFPYRPSFLVNLLDSIQCPHEGDRCKFLLVDQQWCVYE